MDVLVPDLGDFKDIPVLEVLVKAGDEVQAEQSLLNGYGTQVATVSTQAKGLVGRIAFDSFKRVRQSFYDLVLKADVGVIRSLNSLEDELERIGPRDAR